MGETVGPATFLLASGFFGVLSWHASKWNGPTPIFLTLAGVLGVLGLVGARFVA